jgi:hypothetical protein
MALEQIKLLDSAVLTFKAWAGAREDPTPPRSFFVRVERVEAVARPAKNVLVVSLLFLAAVQPRGTVA